MASEDIKRKLTTILATDVEGYTRLMRADEEATLKTLGEYREIIDGLIARHDGRVFSTGGDSVLAEFGSAVEAVRCAISIQEEIASRNTELADDRKLMFRIGINVGDVMIRDDDLFGDGVNVAARLEGLAQPGGVCVSGSVFEQIKHKLSLGFEDMGAQEVKNIAEPVAAYRLVPGPVSVAAATSTPSAATRWRIPAMAAVVIVIIAAGGLAWWQPWAPDVAPESIDKRALKLPDKPSIAVLPFTNMSDDKQQEYFSDGITEDIITDLSKVSGLFVIARNSSFKYKGKSEDVRNVARDLGVRHILEGSVRKAGNRARITAQLIDGETGNHVWTERYDRDLTDVFAVQDEVTREIVSALTVNLTQADKNRLSRKGTENLKAYDAVLRGQAQSFRFTKDANGKARQLYQQAIDFDPKYARAYSGLAWTHLNDFRLGWSKNEQHSLEQAFELAQRAIALDDFDAVAHTALSDVYLWTKRHERALAEAERAAALNPNAADTFSKIGDILTWAGEPEKGIRQLQKVMRLNPNHPMVYTWHLGHANFVRGDYEKAAAAFERCRDRNPNFAPARLYLAASYGQLGRLKEARVESAKALELSYMDWSESQLKQNLPYKDPSDLDRLIHGLRIAGRLQ